MQWICRGCKATPHHQQRSCPAWRGSERASGSEVGKHQVGSCCHCGLALPFRGLRWRFGTHDHAPSHPSSKGKAPQGKAWHHHRVNPGKGAGFGHPGLTFPVWTLQTSSRAPGSHFTGPPASTLWHGYRGLNPSGLNQENEDETLAKGSGNQAWSLQQGPVPCTC